MFDWDMPATICSNSFGSATEWGFRHYHSIKAEEGAGAEMQLRHPSCSPIVHFNYGVHYCLEKLWESILLAILRFLQLV